MSEREEDERKDSKKTREKDKDKGYVAFHSEDDSDGNLEEEEDDALTRSKGKKLKREKSRPLAGLRITKSKKQKKDKDKEKEKKEKEKEKEKEKRDKDKEKDKDKRKKKKSETLSPQQPTRKAVFGVALEVAVNRSKLPDGIELPRVFREGIMYIEENGLEIEGIYRVSGSKSKVEALRENYEQGNHVNIRDWEPEVVTSLVKLYLRELPESVLTTALAPKFSEISGMPDKSAQLEKTKQLLAELPVPNRTLLGWLFVHMSHVMEKSSINKMSLQNVGIVLSPTMNIGHGVLFIFLNCVDELFPNTKLVKFTGLATSDVTLDEDGEDIPDSPTAIAAALARQEAILAQLHEDLNSGKAEDDEGKDEMLWEVQRKVTQLKRKLRVAKRAAGSKVAEESSRDAKPSETAKPAKVTEGQKPEDAEDVEEEEEEAEEAGEEDEGEGKDRGKEDDKNVELIKMLEASEAELLLEQEELVAIGSGLKRRIEDEKQEIERLKEEVAAILEAREKNAPVTDPDSSSSSDSETEDAAHLEDALQELREQNEELERSTSQLCVSLHDERQRCAELTAKMKLLERNTPATEKPDQEDPPPNRPGTPAVTS